MSDRSWFYAARGQQQGPYTEAELHDLVATGTVTADTLVWTEGMAEWQRAGEIPGLLSGAGTDAGVQGGAISIDFGIWEYVWRSLVLFVGLVLVIPTPWVVAMYCRWIVNHTHVPGRPNIAFTGRAVTLMWYYLVFIIFILAAIPFHSGETRSLFNIVSSVIQIALYWFLIKWVLQNISSMGQPLGLRFAGSLWAFLGWSILAVLAIFTIIGWAWVYAAQLRWVARNIQGTRHEVVYNGTGLELLWRSLVTFVACLFVIPIPWAMRWLLRWQVSQFALMPRANP